MGINSKSRKFRNQRRHFNKMKKKGLIKTVSSDIFKPSTEDLILNAKEHKILKNYTKRLQERFDVKIHIPKTTSSDSDNFFVSVEGLDSNRAFVKTFLSEKMKELTSKHSPVKEYDPVKDCSVDVVTLSDSESESEDISIVQIAGLGKSEHDGKRKWYGSGEFSSSSQDTVEPFKRNRKRKAKNMEVTSQGVSSREASDLDEVASTTDDKMMVSKKMRLSESVLIVEEKGTGDLAADFIPLIPENESSSGQSNNKHQVSKKMRLSESVLIVEEKGIGDLAADFIPLIPENKSSSSQSKESANKSSCSNSTNSNEVIDDSVIIIDEPVPSTTPRRLRPIVIDGSNVAMLHGKTSHTFSVKGIKLAIDYFLNRGHTQVTAFVPQYRKNRNPFRNCPTTDVDLLEEMENKQQVVYTPSRRVNGRCINSYDDRFVVQLAASNGGVIVSNDNFRDLIDESDAFKQAIEQRLLMFCFVGDQFMVPDDPLGRDGPKLKDFLSFPPEDQNNAN